MWNFDNKLITNENVEWPENINVNKIEEKLEELLFKNSIKAKKEYN